MSRHRELWLSVLEQMVEWSAHEVKDVLNGVSLNVEVIRSRAAANGEGRETSGSGGSVELRAILPFTVAAAAQTEILTRRTEALLFLVRPARAPADVTAFLRHLTELAAPALRSDGGTLTVDGLSRPAPTTASPQGVRLALTAGLLALREVGGACRCLVEPAVRGSNAVVRFSHEPAVAIPLDPGIAEVVAEHSIAVERSAADLLLVFPGS